MLQSRPSLQPKSFEMPFDFIYLMFVAAGACRILTIAVETNDWFDEMNSDLSYLNRIASNITWRGLLGLETDGVISAEEVRTRWRNAKCEEVAQLNNLSRTQSRMAYLLCRGPKYTVHQSKLLLNHLDGLSNIYRDSRICRNRDLCYAIEPDLDVMMRESRDPAELLWAWTAWRAAVGPPSLQIYPTLIHIQNQAAQNNGYNDIGECWREELETPNLEEVVERLYQEVAPFHKLLHGFVRHRLIQFYGQTNVPAEEPIPAHLLGNMWAQSWESLMDILLPAWTFDMDEKLRETVRKPEDMLKRSEEFYESIGLPPMTAKFWKYSQISPQTSNESSCHGTAADLFDENDYRMLLCAQIRWEDFYVVHHEMGHIEYFMSYKDLPTIFRDGANSAMQEAIGDTVMLAVESPTNLVRMGIIPNLTEEIKLSLMLKQALKNIPKIAFGLVVDKWRWNVMMNKIPSHKYNQMWWHYRWQYEGIQAPIPRGKYNFDPAAKYHIADNTPFIRYFLSEFLQFQIFDVLCEGQNRRLYLCDIYGNKQAGKKLRKLMGQGSKQPWDVTFEDFSKGKFKTYSAAPLLDYFDPLIKWLQKEVMKHKIPLGW
ncbi:angiotensin-converting enzyme-like [Cimex lectularius]|uniref:Angiotensin-converting enzyme n=1 Tax=Cimex lectularius TaxID=79782 RepID=A0A8I6RLK9_CIMLE|nr:angiotensin-converting enzyme-like [Cimex lectularius]